MAKILLAEDEASVRSFVRRGLESQGHDITEACDGGEALEMLAGGNFDLLLADIVMPVMDGIALALKALADYPDLPVFADDRLCSGKAACAQSGHHDHGCLVKTLYAGPVDSGRAQCPVRQGQ